MGSDCHENVTLFAFRTAVCSLYPPRYEPPQAVKSHVNQGSRLLAISLSIDEEAKALAEGFGAVVLLDKMNLASTLIPTIMQLKRERSAAAQRLLA